MSKAIAQEPCGFFADMRANFAGAQSFFAHAWLQPSSRVCFFGKPGCLGFPA
ncbi:hypothetical protein [Delftia tsuruhatensis]|uniref:hypothetical protein n=1 Tax=Delftia tsuruhatensis TaxID=180282 RepID=UPI003A85247E